MEENKMKKNIKIISLILVIVTFSSLLLSCAKKNVVPIGGDGKFTVPEKIISDETIYTDGAFKYAVYDDGTAIITEHTGDEIEIVE